MRTSYLQLWSKF